MSLVLSAGATARHLGLIPMQHKRVNLSRPSKKIGRCGEHAWALDLSVSIRQLQPNMKKAGNFQIPM